MVIRTNNRSFNCKGNQPRAKCVMIAINSAEIKPMARCS